MMQVSDGESNSYLSFSSPENSGEFGPYVTLDIKNEASTVVVLVYILHLLFLILVYLKDFHLICILLNMV